MRKLIFGVILTLTIIGINTSVFTYADETSINEETTVSQETETKKEGIEINKKNFPDKYLREKVKEQVDKNRDNVLQKKEIKQVTKFAFCWATGLEASPSEPVIKEDYYVFNCKGLEYFTNLEELYLDNWVYENNLERITYTGKRGYKNFDKIYQLKKLKKLTLGGDNNIREFYFNKLPNLKVLRLWNIQKVKKIKFNSKLTFISISILVGNIKLDMSKATKLKKFYAQTLWIKSVKFGKNKKLKRVQIGEGSGGENNVLQTVDVSGAKNLKTFYIRDCPKIKKVKFGKNRKLVDLRIRDTKNLKEIDLKGCRVSKQIDIYKGTKIKNLWNGFKGRISYCS